MTTTAQTVTAADVQGGDLLVVQTLTRQPARMRVGSVERLETEVWTLPLERGARSERTVHDTVRLHLAGGGSLDYPPTDFLTVVR